MAERTRVWAVVDTDKNDDIVYFTEREDYAVFEMNHLEDSSFGRHYKIVELTPAPEKIKMTQAEFDEFEKVKKRLKWVSSAFVEIHDSGKFAELYNFLFDGQTIERSAKAQEDFARLWANDNPAELVEIEKVEQYHLILKLDKDFGVDDFPIGVNLTGDANQFGKFTDDEIEELGGDEWMDKYGLKKVEIEE